MRLRLSRASPSDFDQLVPLAWHAFEGDAMRTIFFGHETPKNYARLKQQWIKDTQKTSDLWLKIEDLDAEEVEIQVIDDDGETKETRKDRRIVAAANWQIYASWVPPTKETDENGKLPLKEFDHLPLEREAKDSQTIVSEYMELRHKETAEPHLLLYLLFVDPEYHGKGMGTMVMKWGNDLADSMMLPCWLESSPKGKRLYLKTGYEHTSTKTWETASFGKCECVRMRRAPRVEAMEGKDLKRLL